MSPALPAVVPVYLEAGSEPTLALFQPAADGTPRDVAVLICAPWGWDEVASYRSRRAWAQRLAAAGHASLRLDLPGSGDSGGAAADPRQVDAWVTSIGLAVDALRERSGASRVAAIGLGLGGLLAREAAARGAGIDDLVLWGAPAKGKAFVRETRVFSRLQEGGPESADGEPQPAPLPEGWLESGGFVLSAETLADLKALDPAAPSSLRRALLLDRDGIEPDAGLRASLEEAGVEVELGPGEGWGEMVSHPERTRLPAVAADHVAAWLGRSEGTGDLSGGSGDAPAAPVEATPPEVAIRAPDGTVRESPLFVAQPFGHAFGVLTEPSEPGDPDLCAVFLNAGAIRHAGPNRIWVETARRWAARGVPALRIDLEGIGESDGDAEKRWDTPSFYDPDFTAQVVRALDALEERGVGKRFLLIGLCAGGYWSFQAALEDGRVERAVLLNAGALTWHDNLLEQRQASKLDRVFQWSWWRKLFDGEVSLSRLWYFARLAASKAVAKVRGRIARLGGGSGPSAAEIDTDLDRLRERGAELTMAFSAGEPLHTELEVKGILGQLDRWPNLRLVELPGSDHSLRPIAAQRAASELLDAELGRQR